ncbi:protein NRT1/ PTR FAMILY 6.3 [Setaria italica]|uniref:protein NRT1/ PTR FAMILY 6.3 n=1 Tax=Setaria italica TaxID=4555 RepID=UPI0006474A11|nr:protein NRT1/ PTR FAMILY 6.3 [Setaria italica]
MALGTGGLKSSVSGFGSDQFDETDPGELGRMARFFSWLFFFMMSGGDLGAIAGVHVDGRGGGEAGAAQMTTFSVAQAQAMDRRLGSSFQVPAGSLTVFLVASILLAVPVYDRLAVPLAGRLTANPHGLSPLQRISVGLLFSTLAMAAAALTERHRRDASLAGATPSVFLLVPQFFLVGAGEAFTYIGQLDFFLRECPRGMKTMSTGLFLSTLSLGCFLSTAIVTAVHAVTTSAGRRPWLTEDLDKGSLHRFYWLLAAIGAANLLAFVAVARGYVYKQEKLADDDVAVHA